MCFFLKEKSHYFAISAHFCVKFIQTVDYAFFSYNKAFCQKELKCVQLKPSKTPKIKKNFGK